MRRRLVLLVSAVLLALLRAPGSHAQAGGDLQIAVSFTFPDGTEKHATVSAAEVERLSGQRPAYTLLPWSWPRSRSSGSSTR